LVREANLEGRDEWDCSFGPCPFLSSHHHPQYLKKLHTQERAVEEVKLAIKPYYQKKDITKDEYKDILRKAVHKVREEMGEGCVQTSTWRDGDHGVTWAKGFPQGHWACLGWHWGVCCEGA
jgi:hypothetical protein